jgi:hypothetical protein
MRGCTTTLGVTVVALVQKTAGDPDKQRMKNNIQSISSTQACDFVSSKWLMGLRGTYDAGLT